MADPQQTAKQIPMLAPDGTQGMVDAESAQQAVNAGYKPALQMRAPNGDKGLVGLTDMGQALKSGYMTEGQYTQKQTPPPTQNGGIMNSLVRGAQGVASVAVDAGKGMYHTLVDPAQGVAEKTSQRMGLPVQAYRTLISPSVSAYKQGAQMLNSARDSGDVAQGINGLGHVIASAIPGIGPAVVGVADQIRPDVESGNYAGAVGKVAANAGLAYLTGKAVGALSPEANVPGQNYTTKQAAAHTGLISRANGMGDNYFPHEATEGGLSDIRQAAADNPSLAKVATAKGSTPQQMAAYQAVIQKANTALEAEHAPVLAQHANVPADVSSIQAAVSSALPSTLTGLVPEDAAAISQLRGRLGTINTLGGLNDLRQFLNDQVNYRKGPISSEATDIVGKGMAKAALAARDSYYDQLQQASGINFQPLKARQSALMTIQQAVGKMASPLSKAQGIADEPSNLQTTVGTALEGGTGALKTGPISGAAKVIGERIFKVKPLTQPNYLIRKSLANLPDATPTPVTAQPPAPPPQIVGVQPSPQLPPPYQAQLPRPSVPTTSVVPQDISLPSPAGIPQISQGNIARLLSDSSSAMEPQAAYPALNEQTARMRVDPTRFQQPASVQSAGTRPVTPQGQVLTPLQRFLNAGDLEKDITNPSTDDLKRAIAGMRKRAKK